MQEAMRDTIIQFIRDEYVEDESLVIKDNTPLISSGLVDSFSMVSLKLFLEEEYGIRMSDAEASTQAFDNVASIITLVQKKLAEKK